MQKTSKPHPFSYPKAHWNPFLLNKFGRLQIPWLLPLIAVAEIVGGLWVIFPKTRALGALVILPVMVGVLPVNIVGEISGLVITLPMAAILGWIMYVNRYKYRPLFK